MTDKTRFLRIALVLSFYVSTCIPTVGAYEFTGKVVKVLDGDTICVLGDGQIVKIRLSDIDCPEKCQPFGKAAKLFTSSQTFGKNVVVVSGESSPSVDRYGRTIASVFLPDGTCLNNGLLREGYAWQYTKYSNNPDLAHLQDEARSNGRGLWIESNPIPPWLYRKSQRTSP